MRYRMLATDLDGTLLGANKSVSAENLAALDRAREAGMLVVPCTGRSWREAKDTVDMLIADGWSVAPSVRGESRRAAGVFACGSIVNDLATGQPLDSSPMDPALAAQLVEYLADLPDAVLVFRDPSRAGHEYLVTGRGKVSRNTEWWFEATKVKVHHQKHLTAADLHDTLRVGMVGTVQRMRSAGDNIRRAFSGRVLVQNFLAVQMPDPEENMYVLEIFPPHVDKWRGVSWLAAREGIRPQEIAALGDQINDLAMVHFAGCGIAMDNAVPELKAVARHVTRHHEDHGVAFAIDQLLAEKW